jgi:sugar diacid utilization regulator
MEPIVNISQIAAQIGESVPALAERVIDEVWERLPGYDANHMVRRDLESFVTPDLEIALRAVVEARPLREDEVGWARELGEKRALQGVPVESVMHSWRAAERVMLDSFMLHAPKLDPGEIRTCARRLSIAFDALIRASVAAYRRTQDEITVHYEQVAADLVARLAGGERIDPEEVAEQARIVGVDANRPYQAAALGLGPTAKPPAIGHVQRHVLAALGPAVEGRILSGTHSGLALLLIPLADTSVDLKPVLDRAMRRPELWEDALVGVGSAFPRLADVGRSCVEAVAAVGVGLRRAMVRTVVSHSDVLADVLIIRNEHMARRLVSTRLGPLHDQEHLMDTLRAYLANGLSVRATARALVVHPNTVSYRLTKIESLLERPIRDLMEISDLVMAMRACALLGDDRPVEE